MSLQGGRFYGQEAEVVFHRKNKLPAFAGTDVFSSAVGDKPVTDSSSAEEQLPSRDW